MEVLFSGVFTGLSGWLNGSRAWKFPNLLSMNNEKGIRACSPLTGLLEKGYH